MTDMGKIERDTTFIKAAEALAGEIIYEATDANGVKVGDLEALLRRRLYDFAKHTMREWDKAKAKDGEGFYNPDDTYYPEDVIPDLTAWPEEE